MTVVRKHPNRRIHAPKTGRTFPNALQPRNKRRVASGIRSINCHGNANVIPLYIALKSEPRRAVYGWLKTKNSILAQEIAQHERKIENSEKLLENFMPSRFNREKDRQILIQTIANEKKRLSKEYYNLANVQRARHIMEYQLAEDMPDKDRLLVNKRVFHVGINMTDINGNHVDNDVESILKALDNMGADYENVQELIMKTFH